MNKGLKKLIGVTTAIALVLCSISFGSLEKVSERKVYAETSGKTYYVSQSGGYGSDELGSISNPFTSIQEGINRLQPGDTLLIRGGTYHETTDVTKGFQKDGSENAWITIKNYPGEEVIMDGDYRLNWAGKNAPDAITFNGVSYWKVEGIKMTEYTGAGIYITGSSSHIEMNDLTIWNIDYPTYRSLGTSGIQGENSSYCTVRNSNIYNIGLKVNKPKDHGIYIGYGASNWVFEGNKIHDNAGAAIQMYGEPNGGSNSTVQNNHLYNNHAYGLAIGSKATNNYINNNVFYGNTFDDVYMLEGAVKNYFRNNLFLSANSNYNVQLSDESSIDNSFDNNIYYKANGIPVNRYDKTLKFDEWKAYSQEYSGRYINSGNEAEALISSWSPVSGKKYTSSRLSGLDRFETARKIAEGFNNGAVGSVVITSGYNFPNALSGSVLAKKLNAPILLAGNSSSENSNALQYVNTHLNKDGTVYILGNSEEIKEDVVRELNNLGYGNVKRLSGSSKYDTIKVINDEIDATEGTPIVVAGGNAFADGLSISTIAASKGYPIVLTDADALSKEALDTIKKVKPSKVYIVGGAGVVSENIKEQIKTTAGLSENNITRIWGQDRYETSLNIAKHFELKSDTVTFASGENFPDALSGSVYAAKCSAPVILVSNDIKKQKAYVDSKEYLNQVIFGGTGVISDTVKANLIK